MKFLKAFLLFVAVLLLGGIVLAVGGWFMLRGTPAWYKPNSRTQAQRRLDADSAEDKLITMRNWAQRVRASAASKSQRTHNSAAAIAAAASSTGPLTTDLPTTTQAATVLAHEPQQAFQIQFTDAELNAFFDKWADVGGRRAVFERYIEDPRLILRDNQLILAGNVKDLGTVVSMQFEPTIDEQGNLQMNLVHVLGGILPLPDAMWARQREKIERTLKSNLPTYQQAAKISADGAANSAAASAGMDKLLLAVLHREPADPVVFVPYDRGNLGRSLPVKITAVSIGDNTLTITADQMTSAERDALLQRLRAAYDDATAVAR